MFGLTIDKIMILAVIAVFLIGPQQLPAYAGRLAKLVRSLRDMADGAKNRMREEFGPEFDEVDWVKLDPRQYDPRRIIRDALLEDSGISTPRATISAPRSNAAPRPGEEIAEPDPVIASNSAPTIERN